MDDFVRLSSQNSAVSVMALIPADENEPFWHEFEQAMTEAAKQFNFSLVFEPILPKDHNRFDV